MSPIHFNDLSPAAQELRRELSSAYAQAEYRLGRQWFNAPQIQLIEEAHALTTQVKLSEHQVLELRVAVRLLVAGLPTPD